MFINFLILTHLFLINPTIEEDTKEFQLPSQLTSQRFQSLSASKSFRDLFTIEQFVVLETNDKSFVGSINAAIPLGEFWFVFDADLRQFVQFDRFGSFVRIVGGIGSGPGEYVQPTILKKIYDDQLGLLTYRGGGILVYDKEGRYVKKYATATEFAGIIPNNFIWNQKDHPVFADMHTRRNEDLHAILTREGDKFKIQTSFSPRIPFMEQAFRSGAPSRNFTCFTQSDNRIWTGNPFEARLKIFDTEGKYLGLIRRKHPEQLTLDLVKEVGLSLKDQRKLSGKFRNYDLFAVGDVVIATLFNGRQFIHDIYDTHGNLLIYNFQSEAPFGRLINSDQDLLIGELPRFPNAALYHKYLTSEEFEMLTASGWDPDSATESNPVLVVGRLK